MEKKIFAIVLIPSRDLIQKCYVLTKKIRRSIQEDTGEQQYEFSPHITLIAGCVNENNISHLCACIEDIAKKFSPLALRAIALSYKENLFGLVIEKTDILYYMHEEVVRQCLPYMIFDEGKVACIHAQDVGEHTILWATNFVCQSSFKNFFPHITLGIGKKEEKGLDIIFTASKISLWQLGYYGVCNNSIHSAILTT